MSCYKIIKEHFADRKWCSQIEIDMAAAAQLPALWSAEEPNLYVLVISVVTTDGAHLDSESVQVLFLSPAASACCITLVIHLQILQDCHLACTHSC